VRGRYEDPYQLFISFSEIDGSGCDTQLLVNMAIEKLHKAVANTNASL
jgi:hypothetical protein